MIGPISTRGPVCTVNVTSITCCGRCTVWYEFDLCQRVALVAECREQPLLCGQHVARHGGCTRLQIERRRRTWWNGAEDSNGTQMELGAWVERDLDLCRRGRRQSCSRSMRFGSSIGWLSIRIIE